MPRGRGGQRQGSPGTLYENRNDLASAEPVAVKTAPNQQYGQQTAQVAAQKEVPIAAPPGPALPAPVTTPSASPAPGGAPPTAAGGVLHPTSAEPGELSWTGPSQRPQEPITAGMPQGPGPGTDVLTGIGAIANRRAPQDTATTLLATLAMQPTAGSQLRDLARLAAVTGR